MENLLVAIIGAVGLLAVAIISNRGRQHAKAAREQVQNSHDTNLREELDERHAENRSKLDTLVRWQSEHQLQADQRSARISRIEVVLIPLIVSAIVAAIIRTTELVRIHRKA